MSSRIWLDASLRRRWFGFGSLRLEGKVTCVHVQGWIWFGLDKNAWWDPVREDSDFLLVWWLGNEKVL